MTPTRCSKRKDLGDFQTPPALVEQILDTLERVGERPTRVLEPTCGLGHFIAEWLDRPRPPGEIIGLEIQPEHAEAARFLIPTKGPTRVAIETADLFRLDLRRDLEWQGGGPLLVVGNLPWVTTSVLGASGGSNGPTRSNFKGLAGLEAMTGRSNFDISEAIWLKLIRELASESPTIALLCKSAVARSVLQGVHSAELPITRASIWRIDALRWFRASVDACLLRVEVGPGPGVTEVPIFAELSDLEPESTLGLGGGVPLIADLPAYRRVAFADGTCPLNWRQGIKHDAAPVMELTLLEGGMPVNKLGEVVDVEPDHLYPLLKGADLGGAPVSRPRRAVIVTQRRLGEETRSLEVTAPQLWDYLARHSDSFERRRSSIYRGRPLYSMFGVGDYSFAPYKIAVSGLHENARFRVVESAGGVRPCSTTLATSSLVGPSSRRAYSRGC